MDREQRRVEANKARQWDILRRGAFDEEGAASFPSVLSLQRFEWLRENTEEKMFSAWYLNEPRAEGERIFPATMVRYFDDQQTPCSLYPIGPLTELHLHQDDPVVRMIDGERMVPLYIVICVDPAPTVGQHSDFTGIAVVGFDHQKRWWVLEAREVKNLPTDLLNTLIGLCRMYAPQVMAIETTAGNVLDASLLNERFAEMSLPTKVVGYSPLADRARVTALQALAPRGRYKKAAQIEGLEPILRARRVLFRRGHVTPLVRQLLGYPYLDHDDVLDAFSMCRGYEKAAPVGTAVFDAYEKMDAKREAAEYAAAGVEMFPAPERPRAVSWAWVGPATPSLPSRPA